MNGFDFLSFVLKQKKETKKNPRRFESKSFPFGVFRCETSRVKTSSWGIIWQPRCLPMQVAVALIFRQEDFDLLNIQRVEK
jgi:hypothetical protein